ncbi:putative cytochrome c oxidase subunit 3 [Aliiroseovarius sp. xm-v-201]|uniref:cytochrome c oxidase subunit 3 family protein n=1 Tax=unclassified Aliiroseovarius TaxID=2623558 RepID=UPI0019EBAE4D|nr:MULTISPECIES: cytochrome c oxidase subunit 3 family protein [unclassified Aliiroseovarius]NRP49876.1 putative cytochrome c oxidase subunit 3 [Aliiroseovarius sp. xm-m-354]NRQ04630.1 putative cytochrome c oxidase subunit 3 [Aliiroseovarius sp. xm-m-309]NRQ07834.1 putative cytochrome c oxidase subunit 3 [Aliiroseovarius sp. xm-v-201]
MSQSPASMPVGVETEHPLEKLPGDLMIWVLIVSELLVFGAGLLAFLGVRIMDPVGFAQDQDSLNRVAGAVNTIVLISSGFCAARAVASPDRMRIWLSGAMLLGVVFLVVKYLEYSAKAALGIGIETSQFFTFYYLLTGFHAMHVVAGLVIFALVMRWPNPRNLEGAAMFWHMVDLVWVLLFPIIYLVR